MLTKTKIALGSVLVLGLASAAVAQQAPTDPRSSPRVFAQPAPYADYDSPSADIVVRPGFDSLSGNVIRERDDFTGYSPRSRSDRYSDTPGNQ